MSSPTLWETLMCSTSSINVVEPSPFPPCTSHQTEKLATQRGRDGTRDKVWCGKENRQHLYLFGGERN